MKKVLIVGCTHGNESIGFKVINSLQALLGRNKNVHFLIANPYAFSRNVRFLETDLNRSFPGKIDGSFEERLAHQIRPMIMSYDIVVDVHSTSSGLRYAVVIKKVNDETIALAKCTNAKYVLHMDATQGNALISDAKVGIAFEYGSDKDPRTYRDTLNGVCLILQSLGYVVKTNAKPPARKIFFRISEVIPKPKGFIAIKGVKNYKRLMRGQVYAHNPMSKKVLRAGESFCPILFGENSYKDIFGFKGDRVFEMEEKLNSSNR